MSGRFAAVLTVVSLAAGILENRSRTPYSEQHFPSGQSPHTVFPFVAPQLPSVVMDPVGGGWVGSPSTGSATLDVLRVSVGVVHPL